MADDAEWAGGSSPLHPPRPAQSRLACSEDAEAAGRLPLEPPMDPPMELLPTQGARLQHYTRARPRPQRTHRQPPARATQVQSATPDSEPIGTGTKLDEGLDEFFSSRLIQDAPTPAPLDISSESEGFSSSGSRNLKKKIGHFFAFKKPKATKGEKPEKDPDQTPLLVKSKKSTLTDILRGPCRSGGSATLHYKDDDGSGAEPKALTELSRTPDPTKRIHHRYSREGKSQSLILLSGDDEEVLGIKHDKKRHSEKGDGEIYHTFEQRVHVMLHRIGVTRVLSSEAKKKQAKDGEIKKAGSEGDIVDNKSESPPPSLKPRTHSMSTESSSRVGASDKAERADLTAAQKQSAVTEERVLWKDLGRQLNEELRERCAELQSSPLRPTGLLERTSRLTEGIQRKPEDSWSLPGLDRKSPIPSPRRNGNADGSEAQNPMVAILRSSDDNQLKLRPRLKHLQDRRAFSVHEEQLRDHGCMLELEHVKAPLFMLRKSPVMNRNDEPKSCTTAETHCTSSCIVKVSTEPQGTTSSDDGQTPEEPHSTASVPLEDHGEDAVETIQNPAIDQRTDPPATH